MGAFEVTARCGRARRGVLKLKRARVETPVFMPVATGASIRGLFMGDFIDIGYDMVLVNTYHCFLRPGLDVIGRFGSVHAFMGWPRAVLSDSGGFQVFSLSSLADVSEEGVSFRSHIDGSPLFLSPEESIRIQLELDSDVVMAFDQCIPYPVGEDELETLTMRSARWTERSHREFVRRNPPGNLFFGIVQGGMSAKYRRISADRIMRLGCDGLAIGGLSVGEPKEAMYEVLDEMDEVLDERLPRYLMGVGAPEDILNAVARGVDMFDCVIPTRMGRHGVAFTSAGKVRIKNAVHRLDDSPLDPACGCPVCARWSRSYIHHLFRNGDHAGGVLLTLHNLYFFRNFMERIREAVSRGTFHAEMERMLEPWAAARAGS